MSVFLRKYLQVLTEHARYLGLVVVLLLFLSTYLLTYSGHYESYHQYQQPLLLNSMSRMNGTLHVDIANHHRTWDIESKHNHYWSQEVTNTMINSFTTVCFHAIQCTLRMLHLPVYNAVFVFIRR